MTIRYAVHINDHEVTVAPLNNLEVVEVEEDDEAAFIDFIDTSPTLAQIFDWLAERRHR